MLSQQCTSSTWCKKECAAHAVSMAIHQPLLNGSSQRVLCSRSENTSSRVVVQYETISNILSRRLRFDPGIRPAHHESENVEFLSSSLN
mmetsp:Transcript_21073/g.58367  ORF Transcript_21073/g.58367 Transcript_21073/m.58367 type:complete len:89 (+) Transcript_21073:2338-2604(+)